MGEPRALRLSIIWIVHLIGAHALVLNGLVVMAQAAVGLALVTGRGDRLATVASVPIALGIWWIGEGFGALPTGFASLPQGAPGAAVLYPVLAVMAWPSKGDSGRPAPPSGPAARILWAALWCGQALLLAPWRFPSGQVLQAGIEENNRGIASLVRPVAAIGRFSGEHGPEVMTGLALVSIAVGAGAFAPRLARASLTAGALLVTGFWVVFQGAGALLVGQATDAGTGPLVILTAAMAWPSPVRGDDRRRNRLGVGSVSWSGNP